VVEENVIKTIFMHLKHTATFVAIQFVQIFIFFVLYYFDQKYYYVYLSMITSVAFVR